MTQTKPISADAITPNQLRRDFPAFWQQITHLADIIGVDITGLKADHAAIRINDWQEAERLHQAWLQEGLQLSNAVINGRPIIILELAQPIYQDDSQSITILELPYPSDKIYSNQGWEHVEFVVPSKAQTIEQFVDDVKQAFPELKNRWDSLADQGISIKLSSPKGEGERLANPTIAFKLVDSKEKGVCIKLHPHTLKEVILSEYS